MLFQIPKSLEPLYPKRPYHNLAHIQAFDWDSCPSVEAFWAAVFHDFVYDPLAKDNEEKSYTAFFDYIRNSTYPENTYIHYNVIVTQVRKLILSTKDHVKFFDPNDPDMVWLHKNDLACFRSSADIAGNEKKMLKEYQFTKLPFYKSKRLQVLRYYQQHPLVSKVVIDSIAEYLAAWKPNCGIFCGSFDPFHRGHYDILQQANNVFDKVIIAQGQNEDKNTHEYNIHDVPVLKYYECDIYSGSLFIYLDRKKQELTNVSLVRGLRNYHDLHDESGLFNFGSDMTDVPFVYFISKSENLHISSGAIRKLKALGKDVSQYMP